MKHFGRLIATSFIPAILIFIGKWSDLPTLLIKNDLAENVDKIAETQFILFALGTLWAVIITPIQYKLLQDKLDEQNEIYEELLAFNKKQFIKDINTSLPAHDFTKLKTRIFKEKTTIFDKGVKFATVDYKGATDGFENGKSLVFEVKPNPQGLVGETYESLNGIIDCKVGSRDYNLSSYHKQNLGMVKFCATVPIIDDKDHKTVRAIITVDCETQLSLSKTEQNIFIDQLRFYCAFLEKQLKL